MGLGTTFDCFHGPYSIFNRFREELAKAAGLPDLNKMECYTQNGDDISWASVKPDVLHVLLNHSDCDGKIYVCQQLPLAERLEALADLLPSDGWGGAGAGGGGYRAMALQFAKGLRAAHKARKPVEFA